MRAGFVRTQSASRSPWSRGTFAIALLSLVVASGCRGCGSDKDAQTAAKAKQVKKKEKKPPGKSVGEMVADSGPKGELKKLAMKAPSAPEEAREVAPEVAAARDLILKGEAAAIADGRTQLTEYLKTHETDADAHYWVGRSWMPERVVVPGIEEFNLAIQHDPEFLGARQWIAVAMHKEKRCADAMTHLDKVVEARPDDLNAVYDRAVCEIALDQWDKAVKDLNAYCEKNPEAFCENVKKVEAVQSRATGKRRRMTPEEQAAWKAKQAEGGQAPGRKAMMEKIKAAQAAKKGGKKSDDANE